MVYCPNPLLPCNCSCPGTEGRQNLASWKSFLHGIQSWWTNPPLYKLRAPNRMPDFPRGRGMWLFEGCRSAAGHNPLVLQQSCSLRESRACLHLSQDGSEGAVILHPPLQRLPQQSTQARCETLPETHFSILYSDVLSPLPMRDTLTQKENAGWHFLRKGGTIAHEFFCKVNAQDLKPQTDYHLPAAGHTTSSNGDSSWNNSTWQLDCSFEQLLPPQRQIL